MGHDHAGEGELANGLVDQALAIDIERARGERGPLEGQELQPGLEALVEHACHRFAGAFLYPADKVVADFGAHKRSRVFAAELLNAKRRYGVSMQVALRRLKDLHLLTDAGYSAAFIEFSTKGWRTAEPEPLRPEQPRRFESLVFRGLAQDLFSPSRAAEFMQCRVDELDPTLSHQPEPA